MRILLLCLLLTLLQVIPARAAGVLILQSNRSPVYSEALRGFHTVYKGSERALVLSDYAEVDLNRIVKEDQPRLILAVGDKAAAAAKKVREVPVIVMLSLCLNFQKQPPENVGGITMVAAPEQYLKLFDSMGARKVGVLYDPSKSARYLKRVEHEARLMGLTLVAEPVTDHRAIQAKLEKIKGSVDVLWVLPDSTVFTTVNLEAFILFSMAESVPVVTFSSQYLKNGAAAALDLDFFDIGVQAAELTVSQLKAGVQRKAVTSDPRKTILYTNDSVLRKLGIKSPGFAHRPS
jgi:putative tryptophan/tyrosine transport system substrate-binding protein